PLKVFFNPVLRPVGEERATFFEGCLSVEGYMALVERHLRVELTALDERADPVRWEVSGWPARILQHEVDHRRGMLYVDRMITRTFWCNDEAQERWIDTDVAQVKKGLGA